MLLLCALVLLILSPPGFNIIHFYLFLACLVCGFLLATGMLGTDPLASKLRRIAAPSAESRTQSLGSVPEQVFPFASSPSKGKWAAGICLAAGLALIGLGILIAIVYPSKLAERILAGIPLLGCGILCIWIAACYPTRYIQVTPQSITLKGYFRTVTMPWQNVLVLTARKHFVLSVGGFIPTGILYSLYSKHHKLVFSSQIPGSERLVPLVAQTTGLTWDCKPSRT
jgi:hypothetical protein